MHKIKIQFAVLLLLSAVHASAQLGFCTGSKGEAIFTENFGSGSTYGPALPPGTTTYNFITGAPNDGFYTLFYHSSLYSTWHYSLDHTPNDTNGKMLVVNANAVTSGDFYKKTVTGLCVNTTFEFSAWLLNVYNPNSGFCGAGEIPINVRFEIWNTAETVLLGAGNTGNIMGTAAPLWQQFGIVFTTGTETSVILKMKNNGVGGCGNDLAIDDITFSACGDLTTVSSPGVTGDTYSSCSATSLQLTATTQSASVYYYQWQTSTDGINWTDISGANTANYQTPNITSLTYFRVKAAQDAANLANNFCSTSSNSFTVSISGGPSPAVSNGNHVICSNEPIPALSVVAPAGTSVNWFDSPTGGVLLQSATSTYTPTAAGIYYAETYDSATNCIGSPRTAVELTIVPLPDATITGTTSICSGNTAVVSFNGSPNAVVTYSVDGGTNQTITLNSSGTASITTPALTANSTYSLVSVSSSDLNSCIRVKNEFVPISVNNTLTANISGNTLICEGNTAIINFSGTPNASITYTVNAGAHQTITLDSAGTASVTTPALTSDVTYELISVYVGNLCTQSLSQSITISVVLTPTASISANPTAVCSNQTTTVTITGTPNAIVAYSVDGVNETTTLSAAGLATITTPPLTANSIYTLISSTSASLNTCSTPINQSVTIAVNSTPTASFSGNASVCNGASATIDFTGTPNATVSFSQAGGAVQTIILNSAGTASLVIPNVITTTTYSLSGVASAGANGCTTSLSQSITIAAVPMPTAVITATSASVCSGQSSTILFSGTPDAIVTFAVDNGPHQTLTLDPSGSSTITTSAITSATTYQLIDVARGDCNQALTDSVILSVNPTPNVVFSGDVSYCEGESTAITLSSAVSGTTFSWTVTQNGTLDAVAGNGSQITQLVGLENSTPGTVTYTVTPFLSGCAGEPEVITITINPVPVPQIQDGYICTDSNSPAGQSYTLDTHLDPANHSFQWFFEGDPIALSASTYDATQIGTYTVIATNNAGCVSDPVSALVGQAPQGESLIIHQSAAFTLNPAITVEVLGGAGPFLYQLDDSMFQSSNIFENVSMGMHTITVIDSAYCTDLTANVTVINYPPYFTPNGDGIHDTWNITGIQNATIMIFDRYAKLIKQISPEGFGWDGTFNGKELPSTDYWFTIGYMENGESKIFRAHFALKR